MSVSPDTTLEAALMENEAVNAENQDVGQLEEIWKQVISAIRKGTPVTNNVSLVDLEAKPEQLNACLLIEVPYGHIVTKLEYDVQDRALISETKLSHFRGLEGKIEFVDMAETPEREYVGEYTLEDIAQFIETDVLAMACSLKRLNAGESIEILASKEEMAELFAEYAVLSYNQLYYLYDEILIDNPGTALVIGAGMFAAVDQGGVLYGMHADSDGQPDELSAFDFDRSCFSDGAWEGETPEQTRSFIDNPVLVAFSPSPCPEPSEPTRAFKAPGM